MLKKALCAAAVGVAGSRSAPARRAMTTTKAGDRSRARAARSSRRSSRRCVSRTRPDRRARRLQPDRLGWRDQAIQNRQVDFGASDAPMTPDQFTGCNGCVQIPWAVGDIDLVQPPRRAAAPEDHRDGAGEHLPRQRQEVERRRRSRSSTRASTFPTPTSRRSSALTAAGRRTTSRTTCRRSALRFRSKVGVGTQVNFPAGVGGRGSSGVSAVLSRTNGGIIYADVAFASKGHFSFFRVKNKAGEYQLPGSREIRRRWTR